MKKLRQFFLLLICLLFFNCSGPSRFLAPDAPPNDQRPVPSPQSREVNLAGDNVNKLATLQVQRTFDLARHFRNLANNPRPALNIDAFDEVYPSSWFSNRNPMQQMSPAEIARGPNQGNGPDTNGKWEIVRAKAQGVTPGFSIRDSRGDLYVIKFDPDGSPEMSTGAEAVSTKLFHAAGYNVPENYLVQFDPKMLHLGDKVKLTDKQGKKRFMNRADLDDILRRIQKRPDGMIRVIASKYLAGKPMGSFRYFGVRKDDANDVIPHEHRRELRGLRVIAAWLNHYDTKDNNTLDMYAPEGYVKHYLIDFGSTLGSQGDEPMPPEIGKEGAGDLKQIAKTIGSLGVYRRPWERVPEVRYPAVGNFSSQDFHPHAYKYILPNPAFLNVTNADGFWGTKIVMSFSEAQIQTAVEQGQYSDPAATAYLVKTLMERRNIVGQFWFNRVASLDKFHIVNRDDTLALAFSDIAVTSGLITSDQQQYQYDIFKNNRPVAAKESLPGNTTEIPLEVLDKDASAQWKIVIWTKKITGAGWTSPVNVYLEFDNVNKKYILVGIRR